jgi:ribonuclease P protein component
MSNDFYDDEDLELQEEQPKTNRIKKRREFITLSVKGNTVLTKGLVLQYIKNPANQNDKLEEPKLGFTSSKKVGKSVYRNRARRRMKEASREVFRQHPKLFKKGMSYNFIARFSTIDRPFENLVKDMKFALHNVKE